MCSSSSLSLDLATVFNRFPNGELHQIDMAFIEQSQHYVDKQHIPIPARSVQQDFPLIPPLMNYQYQHSSRPPLLRQLLDVQLGLASTTAVLKIVVQLNVQETMNSRQTLKRNNHSYNRKISIRS